MNRHSLNGTFVRHAILLAVGLALSIGAYAGERDLAIVEPAAAGMSAEGLGELSAAMQGFVDRGELAGVVTVVARHGKIAHFETYGMQDIASGVPMAKDTIFRIYSMTKPIAGVALMTFYEEGRFELDDPVAKFIPEFADLKVAKAPGPDGQPVVEDANHPMTIRELVSHTAGLTYGFFSRSQVDTLYMQANVLDRNSTLKDMVGKLGGIPLRQQPGSAWHYSVAVDVQGYLVEVLAGKPFDEVLKERIFDPLGMKDTGFWIKPDDEARTATMYQQRRGDELAPNPSREYFTKPAFFSGGGGLVSTAMDYTRFSEMMLNGGELEGVRILKPETVELMHTNQLPDGIDFINPMIGNPGNTFGIDVAIVAEPDGESDHPLAKGEYWWYGAGGTWFGINPVQDLIVVGMIQKFGVPGPKEVRVTSKRLAYEAIIDPG
ncbi:MAG: serine hydrolase [Gammaproteobacteria bacterium]|nr:serine hydrolase [Gammaproteobacteria bacterium]MDE0441644.1 serine hydrolase [Gammaproteobacteria bacterium]